MIKIDQKKKGKERGNKIRKQEKVFIFFLFLKCRELGKEGRLHCFWVLAETKERKRGKCFGNVRSFGGQFLR